MGAYLLGPRLVHLGSGSTYQSTIRKVSRPILDTLWRETGETVNLAVLDGREILYLDVIESPHNFRLVSQVGMRRPLHCTALGKAVLTWQSASFRDELLSTTKFEKLTPHSITRASELIAELGRIQRRGYALDDEEVELGARCVAAPVLDSSGQVAAGDQRLRSHYPNGPGAHRTDRRRRKESCTGYLSAPRIQPPQSRS